MKRCPYCKALNAQSAVFCWKCYKRLYTRDIDGYLSLRRRVREKVRDILKYKDIRDLLLGKALAEEQRKREEMQE